MKPALVLEAVAILLLLALASAMPRRAAPWCRLAEGALGRLATRRGLAIALVGFLAFGGSAAVALLGRLPVPEVNDEFSYLLAADTFASGRLTNPPHLMWVHFESMHIIHQPTYASKYPPGQGLALAAGQALGGHPIVGVWLSMALACAALTWMLQAWLPPWWALLGGLLAVVRPGLFSYWAQSYWGGAVAALGGALVWGAVPRLVRRPRVREALVLGLGLAILANSRPFEGLLVSVPAGAVLLLWLASKRGPALRVSIRQIVAPLLVVLALTAGAMAFYNLRVSGDPLRLPYLVHEETYSVAPIFPWQHPRPVVRHRHQVLIDFHKDMAFRTLQRRSLSGLFKAKAGQFRALWRFYLGLAFTVPLVMLPWVLKNRWMRVALLTCSVVVAGLLVEMFAYPHYAAPITGLLFALVLQAMRHLRLWRWRDRPIGLCVVWATLLLWVALAPQMRRQPKDEMLYRAHMLTRLQEEGGLHLVLVRYQPWHSPHTEWVYNAADIDGAKVVWAREMDATRNRELLDHFRGRRAWLLEADVDPSRLTPYLGRSDPPY